MTRLAGFDIPVPPLVLIPVLLGVLVVVAVVVGRLMTRLTRRWLHLDISSDADGPRPVPQVAIPISLTVLSAGLLLLSPELSLLGAHGHWLRVAVTVMLVASCAVAAMRLAIAGVTIYAAHHPAVAPATGVARMAVRIVIGILALLTGLQSLGVPVTPLLTTLGIGSLAVALALQDTLANFFSGLYLLADRPVRPGDYIRLSEGAAEGYVDAIGWRSSRLRTLQGSTIIVPNQKLSQTILTNYHLPQPDMVLTVPVTVPYDTDADVLEGHLLDELVKAGRDLPELVAREPAVRLVELGPAGMVFLCVVRVRDFEAQGRAAHEIRKRVVARLKRERIDLSYPQHVIHEAAPRDRIRSARPPSES